MSSGNYRIVRGRHLNERTHLMPNYPCFILGLRLARSIVDDGRSEESIMGWMPPKETKFVDLKYDGRVHYGRAIAEGQTAGTSPMAIRIELPPGHGDCPDSWFYMGHTSEHGLLHSLADGFVPDTLWIECYRQAWLAERHRNR